MGMTKPVRSLKLSPTAVKPEGLYDFRSLCTNNTNQITVKTFVVQFPLLHSLHLGESMGHQAHSLDPGRRSQTTCWSVRHSLNAVNCWWSFRYR